MSNKTVDELRGRTDAAWAHLTGQLQGMEPHLERCDAPGEWTTREVLSHLLFQPGSNLVDLLKNFAERDYKVVEFKGGEVHMTPKRRAMTLKQYSDALDAQHRGVYQYLDTLPEADLARRKLRIPLFKQFMGTDEIALPVYVGAMYDYHLNDHAGQIAKIRKANGMPDA